jgi:transposase InsO family protein
MVELCREFGISRKTGYKWLARFKEKGVVGLLDRSRRPRGNRLAISADMVTQIVAKKQKHPRWGAKKIWILLVREHRFDDVPSLSTINRVLYQSGLVKTRRRYRPSAPGLPVRAPVVPVAPNDLWTVDFKGWWRAGNGERCEPLTVRDAHSRFVLELRLMRNTDGKSVREVFETLFERYGLPKAIQSDNGSPFASRGLGGLTALSAWWVALGIEVVRSRPGKPTDNGGHERMHSDVRVDIEDDAASSRRLQQLACDAWRDEFNHVRPHEALAMKTPGEVYQRSKRRPDRVVVGGYPEGAAVLQVGNRGAVRLTRQRSLYVSAALAGYPVALEHRIDGFVYVWFFARELGRFRFGVDWSVMPMPGEARDPTHPAIVSMVSPAAAQTEPVESA